MKKPQLVKRVVHVKEDHNGLTRATNYYKAGPYFYAQYRVESCNRTNYMGDLCAAGRSLKEAEHNLACKYNKMDLELLHDLPIIRYGPFTRRLPDELRWSNTLMYFDIPMRELVDFDYGPDSEVLAAVDAVVDQANTALLNSGGVPTALYKEAALQIRSEMRQC